MFIGLFKKLYTIRRYGTQTIVKGYASAPHTDFMTWLDVQPYSPDDLKVLPEGERTEKRVKTFGGERLVSSDAIEGVLSDRLFYEGRWYQCTSSVMWEHTILRHYRSDFVLMSQNEQSKMKPPNPPQPLPNPELEPDPGDGGEA